MKRKLAVLAGILLMIFFRLASAGLDQIVQKAGKDAVMGVVVKDSGTGRVIYQYNANRLFVPASSLKIYTAAASLIMLGPDYRFQTNVYTDAPSIHPGQLDGNLYIVFGGDPTLTSADLFDVLSVLQQKSITHIKGHVILVPPPYTGEKYAPGIVERDKIHPYGAPITPLILDENSLTFTIKSTGPGQRANITVSDPGGRIHVNNALYTKRRAGPCGLSHAIDAQNQLTVKGCITPRGAPYIERIALKNPMQYAESVVLGALRHWQVNTQNIMIVPGQMPAGTKLMNIHQSEALPVILGDTLRPSNNVLASALFLKVGQAYWRQTATWQNSGIAVKQILGKYAGTPMQTATIVDGAGLSRENRVTPMQSVELLSHMQKKFMLSDDFISAMPVPGQKGTLIHRYIAPQNLQSHIHAKTGTMTGVRSLVGYIPSKNRHTLVFAIMTNAATDKVYKTDQIRMSSWKYRELEDEICRYLMNTNV